MNSGWHCEFRDVALRFFFMQGKLCSSDLLLVSGDRSRDGVTHAVTMVAASIEHGHGVRFGEGRLQGLIRCIRLGMLRGQICSRMLQIEVDSSGEMPFTL